MIWNRLGDNTDTTEEPECCLCGRSPAALTVSLSTMPKSIRRNYKIGSFYIFPANLLRYLTRGWSHCQTDSGAHLYLCSSEECKETARSVRGAVLQV